MSRHLTLDVRSMAPPETLDRILSTIADFRAGDTLKVLADFDPLPMHRVLERGGFAHHEEPGVRAPCEVTIWSNS